jgi:hypothetical protein
MDNASSSAEVQEIVEEFEHEHETIVLTLSRDVVRSRRKRDVKAHSISIKRLSKAELEAGKREYPEPTKHLRPKSRAECQNAPRPCPFVSCAHHLYLDVSPTTGSIKFNFPDLEVDEMTESCTLDIADREGQTLELVGTIMNITRERIRQIEVNALAKIDACNSAASLRDFIDDGPLPAVGKRRLPMFTATVIEDDEDEDDGGMSGAPSQLALADWIRKIDRTHNEVRP